MAQTLFRSRSERMLGGLCGGIARTYDLDPNAVRVALIFLAFISALLPCVLAYLVCWIMIPEEPV